MSESLTFIIPVYQSEDTLADCLSSIHNLSNSTIIIVDSENSLETQRIANDFKAKYYNISDNQISKKRNYGANLADSDYLVFLDSDCVLTKEWLSLMAKHFMNIDVVACGNQQYKIPDDSHFINKAWQLHIAAWSQPSSYWLTTQALAVKKVAFDKIKGFNEKLITCEDVDLGYRLNQLGKLVNDPQMEYLHLNNPKSILAFFFKEYWRGLNSFSLGIKHKNKTKELIYIFIPIYALILFLLTTLLPISLFFLSTQVANFLLISYLIIFTPIALFSFYAASKTKSFQKIPQLMLAYFLYILARGSVLIVNRVPISTK